MPDFVGCVGALYTQKREGGHVGGGSDGHGCRVQAGLGGDCGPVCAIVAADTLKGQYKLVSSLPVRAIVAADTLKRQCPSLFTVYKSHYSHYIEYA